ncbi:MAG TPA: LysE family translocator [Gammaproteobacteria bacterium]|nr:LysE family translocator [Gammaproteobacteria bacterium]
MLVAGFTPGPNNLMLATSGVNFGLRRTLPHIIGVALGFPVLFFCIGAGLGNLFKTFPLLHIVLKIVGTVYMVWLAWKIAFAPATKTRTASKPLTFWQSAAFQWVNPKAWIMTIAAITLYTVAGDNYFWQLALMTLLALTVSSTSASTWAVLGATIRHWMAHQPQALRIFNIIMGILLILSVVPILISGPIV